ncbi:MAG: hypothetical protein RID09_06995 [Coleofasciculus sp. G1-WW12-02]|uniref:hypothetical protein n=1 Tax=Coleofasciculus sp. G1-WW12-02 TaxID=3068483 RepID=UPI0032F81661
MLVFDETGKPQFEVRIEPRLIILPEDPDFFIDRISPDWRSLASQTNGEFCIIGRNGLALPATWKETDEYLYGGEYDMELDRQANAEQLYGVDTSRASSYKWKNPF